MDKLWTTGCELAVSGSYISYLRGKAKELFKKVWFLNAGE